MTTQKYKSDRPYLTIPEYTPVGLTKGTMAMPHGPWVRLTCPWTWCQRYHLSLQVQAPLALAPQSLITTVAVKSSALPVAVMPVLGRPML